MLGEITGRRWLYVIAGCVALLFMGCSYAWSVFVVPLEETYGWLRSQTSLAFTLNIIFFSLGIVGTGFLSSKMEYSKILCISATMVCVGFFLTSYVNRVWQVYISYSFLCGGGIGLGYNCVISVVPRWFPEKTGFISGILLVGYAMSAGILSPALNNMINGAGISATFRLLAIICFLGLILTSPFLKTPTQEEAGKLPRSKAMENKKKDSVRTVQVVKMPIFWVEFVMSGLISGTGLILINHISPIMTEELTTTATIAAFVVTLNSAANATGRFVGGVIFDKFGISVTLLCISSLMCLGMVASVLALWNGSVILFIIAGLMGMCAFGANANMIPTVTRELFGEAFFSLNYSVMALNSILAALLPTIAGIMQEHTDGYRFPFVLLMILGGFDIFLATQILKLNRESCKNP